MMRTGQLIVIIAILASLSACANLGPQPGILFTDVDSNRQFDPGVAPGPAGSWVTGQSCAYSVLLLAAWGDAGLDAAMESAGITGQPLRNVTVDNRVVTIVWPFYTKYCTQISAYVPIE